MKQECILVIPNIVNKAFILFRQKKKKQAKLIVTYK